MQAERKLSLSEAVCLRAERTDQAAFFFVFWERRQETAKLIVNITPLHNTDHTEYMYNLQSCSIYGHWLLVFFEAHSRARIFLLFLYIMQPPPLFFFFLSFCLSLSSRAL